VPTNAGVPVVAEVDFLAQEGVNAAAANNNTRKFFMAIIYRESS
jgi:hypothetical protein